MFHSIAVTSKRRLSVCQCSGQLCVARVASQWPLTGFGIHSVNYCSSCFISIDFCSLFRLFSSFQTPIPSFLLSNLGKLFLPTFFQGFDATRCLWHMLMPAMYTVFQLLNVIVDQSLKSWIMGHFRLMFWHLYCYNNHTIFTYVIGIVISITLT